MRLESLEDDVGRDFEENIRHEKDGQGGAVLGTAEAEILLQAEDGGVRNIGAVKKGQQVEHRQDRDDSQIDFGDQPPL